MHPGAVGFSRLLAAIDSLLCQLAQPAAEADAAGSAAAGAVAAAAAGASEALLSETVQEVFDLLCSAEPADVEDGDMLLSALLSEMLDSAEQLVGMFKHAAAKLDDIRQARRRRFQEALDVDESEWRMCPRSGSMSRMEADPFPHALQPLQPLADGSSRQGEDPGGCDTYATGLCPS